MTMRKEQLFIRAITDGRLGDRDLLLCYNIGQFFNEMSLFIEAMERKEKAMDEMMRKYRRK